MATTMNPQYSNPKAIARAGEEIYEKLRAELERAHSGKFVAVDVTTGQHHIGTTPEDTLIAARSANSAGLFHLIRIGFPGAFQIRLCQ